ncbi:MAG TPA: phage holin family protein [Solirubrobacteraceae bacterium]|nr:phage holin family protein [Solirubrobacteraceae bacterium]
MSEAPGSDTRDGQQNTGSVTGAQGIATAITEVSERATLLIREEIELAKAEVTEKVGKLARGAVVAVAAGIFLVTALFFVLIGCAWLLFYELPIGNSLTFFWGFFAMAAILIVLGLIAGFIAAKAVKKGSPPVPSMAIEEARKIRETVSAGADGDGRDAASEQGDI